MRRPHCHHVVLQAELGMLTGHVLYNVQFSFAHSTPDPYPTVPERSRSTEVVILLGNVHVQKTLLGYGVWNIHQNAPRDSVSIYRVSFSTEFPDRNNLFDVCRSLCWIRGHERRGNSPRIRTLSVSADSILQQGQKYSSPRFTTPWSKMKIGASVSTDKFFQDRHGPAFPNWLTRYMTTLADCWEYFCSFRSMI
mmetsp:Transcript_44229/g.90264  ORF Transcript_44229/g.90264 Transcript_44229/m.90264 type:complete len:194 (-) Transcript_44229:102-683(-)